MKRALFGIVVALFLIVPGIVLGQDLPGSAEGKARVYFFRFLGPWPTRAAPVELFDGHSYLGFIKSSHYYGVDLDPGEHLLWSMFANQKWFLRADLEADRVYYVHLWMIPPKFAGPSRPALYPASARKQNKKILKRIETRLREEKFTRQSALETEDLAAREERLDSTIAEIMATWESDWSKQKNWRSLLKEDSVK